MSTRKKRKKLWEIEFEAMYRDQGMVSSRYRDCNFFAAYTPMGIKIIDSSYARRIMDLRNEPRKEDPDSLAKEIKKNPHLHKKIKENLLHNLKTQLESQKTA